METKNRKVILLVNNLKRIIKDRNMELLQHKTYEFIHLNCGFIAHYNLNGFIQEYSEGHSFVEFLERLKEGCCVYGCDLEDNYNYGYTNKEVKESIQEVLTEEVINQIGREIEQRDNQAEFEHYQRLKSKYEAV